MKLALFNKNSTRALYSKVDDILKKSGYDGYTVPAEAKKEASLVTLMNMNKGRYFDLCAVRNVYKLHGIHQSSDRESFFNTLHCVDWGDMSEEMRSLVNALIFHDLRDVLEEKVCTEITSQ